MNSLVDDHFQNQIWPAMTLLTPPLKGGHSGPPFETAFETGCGRFSIRQYVAASRQVSSDRVTNKYTLSEHCGGEVTLGV